MNSQERTEVACQRLGSALNLIPNWAVVIVAIVWGIGVFALAASFMFAAYFIYIVVAAVTGVSVKEIAVRWGDKVWNILFPLAVAVGVVVALPFYAVTLVVAGNWQRRSSFSD